MNNNEIYILGGHQTDFSQNLYREGGSISELFISTVQQGLVQSQLEPASVQVGHVGNFVGELFVGQGLLGGFFGHVDPAMANMPASRHEAACASGSMALLAAMADLESGRYDLACVLGIEVMRNVSGALAAEHLKPAAWVGKEWQQSEYLWPCAFSEIVDIYQQKYALSAQYTNAIAQQNYANGKRNPNAQTRSWQFEPKSFSPDETKNPIIAGNIRRQDCGQITDGAAVVFLATAERAKRYAKERGIQLTDIPRIKGWGHINAPLLFKNKLATNDPQGYLFPHLRQLFQQTLHRAQMQSIEQLDGMEVHDCFSITEYMIIDHCGLYSPGEAWKAIENQDVMPGGRLPINMSGGLIGLGHPVGATGVRMALDCYKQVTGCAGDYQIEQAKNLMTFNLGGSTTTCASLIIGR